MIYAATRQHLRPGPAFPLKLYVNSFSGTQICQRLSYIWVRSAIRRPYGGLKICMHKMIQGDPFPVITLFTKWYILSIYRISAGCAVFSSALSFSNEIGRPHNQHRTLAYMIFSLLRFRYIHNQIDKSLIVQNKRLNLTFSCVQEIENPCRRSQRP